MSIGNFYIVITSVIVDRESYLPTRLNSEFNQITQETVSQLQLRWCLESFNQ